MPVNVLMPQMGESITEGTIVRWFKQPGEQVAKDEPLLEISTDKVDAEVPSPAAGTLSKILHQPGETVAIEQVIAVIAAEGEQTDAEPAPAAADEQEAPPTTVGERGEVNDTLAATTRQEDTAPPPSQPAPSTAPTPVGELPRSAAQAPREQPEGEEPEEEEEDEELTRLRKRSSPLVRRIASEHEVDIAQVPGTGISGRVTKADILSYIERRDRTQERAQPAAQQAQPTAPAAQQAPQPAAPQPRAAAAPSALPGPTPSRPFEGDELREPMSIMRQRIAEHMVESKHTSPHVYTLFEVDVSRVMALRAGHKQAFEAQHGIKLTVTPFFLSAVIAGLKAFPVVNASLDGTDIVYHRAINIGVAVALPGGLIVPVVKNAEDLSIVGLQRAITDLANRARNKQLKPDEVHGSTFSVTNPGQFGGVVGLPVINQPNTAILSIGNVQRKPVVVTDEFGLEAIAIRDVVVLALSFDHRLIDGAVADQFMARVKQVLEAAQFQLS